MRYTINNRIRGAALLLVLLVLTAILSIAFGVSTLMLGETKMTREVPKSLRAYYAAEAGIERKLYDIRKSGDFSDIGSGPAWCSGAGRFCLDADTCYAVDVIPAGPGCTADSYCIKSYGCYKGARRAVEVSY